MKRRQKWIASLSKTPGFFSLRSGLRGAHGVEYCVYEGRRFYTPKRGDHPVRCYRTQRDAKRHLARLKRSGKTGTMTWRDVIGQERAMELAGRRRGRR
jgi:hypothetical protein